MPKLTVDGIEVEVEAGATVLQACEEAGKEITSACQSPATAVCVWLKWSAHPSRSRPVPCLRQMEW